MKEPRPFGLGEKELAILRMLSLSLPRKEIALKLGLSPKTVDWYIGWSEENPNSIGSVLKLRSVAEMVRFAVEHGLVKPGERTMEKAQVVNAQAVRVPAGFKTTGDLAQALLQAAAQAAEGLADVLQVNALCQCTDSLIHLARLQMDAVERQSQVPWLGPGGLPPSSEKPVKR